MQCLWLRNEDGNCTETWQLKKIPTLVRRKIKWRWPTWVLLQYWIDLRTVALWAFQEEQLWAKCNQRAGDNCLGGWVRSHSQQNPHHGCRCYPHRLSGNTVKSIYSLEKEHRINCHDHFLKNDLYLYFQSQFSFIWNYSYLLFKQINSEFAIKEANKCVTF